MNKNWQTYVDSRRLEITCGEAPYLVSRYDTSTGNQRIILMKKDKIATNYILGFDETFIISKHNFRQVDALEYAKNGILEQLLDIQRENEFITAEIEKNKKKDMFLVFK